MSQKGSETLILLSSFHIYESKIYLCFHIPRLLLCKLPHAPVFPLRLVMSLCVGPVLEKVHSDWQDAFIFFGIGLQSCAQNEISISNTSV